MVERDRPVGVEVGACSAQVGEQVPVRGDVLGVGRQLLRGVKRSHLPAPHLINLATMSNGVDPYQTTLDCVDDPIITNPKAPVREAS